MGTTVLTEPDGRFLPLVSGLVARGWRIVRVPDSGRLAANRQKIALEIPGQILRMRVGVYSVSESGRDRAKERRIEITTTYHSGLQRDAAYQDVILGRERTKDLYVGVDPRRLDHGGSSHNASSFLNPHRILHATNRYMAVFPYPSKLFPPEEYQAVFYPIHFDEYCFNLLPIHTGSYRGSGLFSGRNLVSVSGPITVPDKNCSGDVLHLHFAGNPAVTKDVDQNLVKEYESHGSSTKPANSLSAEDFERVRMVAEENGRLGEEFVLTYEAERLKKLNRGDLVSKIRLISRDDIGAGYDVLSYESDGAKRHIEVKSTFSDSMTFNITSNEWRVADQLQDAYYIYRVTNVRTLPVVARIIRNPVVTEQADGLNRTAIGWRVTLL